MKQPHRARWGFSVGPTGMGGPELGLDDHIKGIEWTVDLILVGDFSIWPTFKEKESKILIFFFLSLALFSCCFRLFFVFLFFQVHFGIQNYHMNNRKSWFTTFLHCNYLFKFYQSCCQQDLYSFIIFPWYFVKVCDSFFILSFYACVIKLIWGGNGSRWNNITIVLSFKYKAEINSNKVCDLLDYSVGKFKALWNSHLSSI